MFVKPDKSYDFQKLKEVVKTVTRNLNKIIDINYYPLPETEKSNKRHRPIGIGVQGLADAFILMRYPFDSAEARKLNIQIFETLYYGALEASCELAAKEGTYETYEGCPVSKGVRIITGELCFLISHDNFVMYFFRYFSMTCGMFNPRICGIGLL